MAYKKMKLKNGGKIKDTKLTEHQEKMVKNKMKKLSATKGSDYDIDIDPRKAKKK